MVNFKRTAAPGKATFEVRASGIVRLGGMRPDIHPGGLNPTDFVYLQNVRRKGGDIVRRPGQSLLCNIGGDSRKITGLADLPLGTLRRMMAVGDGCPGISATVGQNLSAFTLEQNPNYQQRVYKPAATRIRPVRFSKAASVDGLVPPVDGFFYSVDNALYRYQSLPVGYDEDVFTRNSGSSEVLVWTAPAAYSYISAMIQHGSVLLIAVVGAGGGGVGTSAIYRWDGLTFTLDKSAINPVTGMAVFRDLAVAGFGGAPNSILSRDSAGTWTSVAPGAGTVTILGGGRCASYADVLYIPSGEDIFSYNGTTLTRIPVATTGVDAGCTIYGLARAFGYLFGSWSTAAPRNRILRFDGATWAPNHKDLFAQDATVRAARSIRLFQGCLLVGSTTLASGSVLWRSPRRTTTGTYVKTIPSGSINGDITEMVEF